MLLVFILLSSVDLYEKQIILNEKLFGTVIKIVDGDTFDLLTKENISIRIRMNGIDCPERKQDFYQAAKDALDLLVFKREVQLVTYGKDRNKRVIADVFISGENINLTMIKSGYAWHYKKYSSDSSFAKAEDLAKATKRGLWQMEHPVAPWEFRRK